jgi:hypothetical protein
MLILGCSEAVSSASAAVLDASVKGNTVRLAQPGWIVRPDNALADMRVISAVRPVVSRWPNLDRADSAATGRQDSSSSGEASVCLLVAVIVLSAGYMLEAAAAAAGAAAVAERGGDGLLL